MAWQLPLPFEPPHMPVTRLLPHCGLGPRSFDLPGCWDSRVGHYTHGYTVTRYAVTFWFVIDIAVADATVCALIWLNVVAPSPAIRHC